MEHYYASNNALPVGGHVVHKKGCTFFPTEYVYLGCFLNYEDAIYVAKQRFEVVSACSECLAQVAQMN